MDITALRTELSTAAPEGFEAYDFLPGAAIPPAIVIGLPTSITFDGSFTLAKVELPVFVIVGNKLTKDAETKLLTAVLDVAAAFRALGSGDNFRSCRVDEIDDFSTMSIGSLDALSAAIHLDLLVTT